MALAVAAFLAIPVASASASLYTVTLDGPATGTVKSTPAGIECSNTPGQEKLDPGDCSHEWPLLEAVQFTAIPDSPNVFSFWTGNVGAGTCDSGSANPCATTSLFLPFSIKATFEPPPPPPPPPVVSTGSAPVVGYYYADLEGTVNPGGNKVTSCRFEYGKTTAYGETVPCSPASLGTGVDDVTVSAQTSELDPGTTYHYRLVAANIGGDGEGEDQTFTTASAPGDGCPNAAIRAEQGIRAQLLPDCMAFEQASPTKKNASFANTPYFSSDGSRLFFRSGAALAETPSQPVIGTYIASRGSSGWTTKPTAAPKQYCCGDNTPTFLTPDLSSWLNIPATEGQASRASAQAFREGIDGSRTAISPLFRVYEGTAAIPVNTVGEGASADLSRVLFYVQGGTGGGQPSLLPGDPLPASGSGGGHWSNVYEARPAADGPPVLSLLARDASGKVWGGRCGALVGAPPKLGILTGTPKQQGTVSADGSRVYFTSRPDQPDTGELCQPTNKERILRRLDTSAGPQITSPIVSECDRVAPACDTTDGDDEYQAASADGQRVFFTTTRQLANSDLDVGTKCILGPNLTSGFESPGCDLYMYDYARPAGERLTQVSVGDASAPEQGKDAEVLGVVAISGDGSRAYFVAKGVLTTSANPLGDTAEAGMANLYVYQRDGAHPGGRTAFVGTLQTTCVQGSVGDCVSWRGSHKSDALALPLLGADPGDISVGGDGHILAFFTKAALSAEDLDGEHKDIYRYDDDAGTLELISTGPAADHGPFEANVSTSVGTGLNFGPNFAQRLNRWVSEDGETYAFATDEALVPGDNDGVRDAYIWKSGQLARLPGGKAEQATVSQSGEQVAFSTFTSLTGLDRDTARDVYVARVGGGYPTPIEPARCIGEACQGPGSGAPDTGAATSAGFSGLGNVKPRPQCSASAKRAQSLSRRARNLRKRAGRVGNPRQATRLRRQATGLSKRAQNLSRSAKRCRQNDRKAGK